MTGSFFELFAIQTNNSPQIINSGKMRKSILAKSQEQKKKTRNSNQKVEKNPDAIFL